MRGREAYPYAEGNVTCLFSLPQGSTECQNIRYQELIVKLRTQLRELENFAHQVSRADRSGGV